MQNNGSMKTVNSMHAITAETRHSFLPSMNAEYEAKASNRTYTIWCYVNTAVFLNWHMATSQPERLSVLLGKGHQPEP